MQEIDGVVRKTGKSNGRIKVEHCDRSRNEPQPL